MMSDYLFLMLSSNGTHLFPFDSMINSLSLSITDTIVFLFQSHILTINDLILSFTCIVIIIYTYYTYKLARIAVVSPSLLVARQAHDKELKDFINSWKSGALSYLYDQYDAYDENARRNNSNLFTTTIKSNWKYNDFIENHITGEKQEQLKDLCQDFEELLNQYIALREVLTESIKNDIEIKLEEIGIDKSILLGGNNDITKLLYPHYAKLLGPKKTEYFRTGSGISSFAYNSNQKEIVFQPRFVVGNSYSSRPIASATYSIWKVGLLEIMESFLSETYINKFEDNIKKIYHLEEKLNQRRAEINAILECHLRYPLLPGIKCDILKHLLSEDIKL